MVNRSKNFQMLELVNKDFKITIINTLKNPQGKDRVSKK